MAGQQVWKFLSFLQMRNMWENFVLMNHSSWQNSLTCFFLTPHLKWKKLSNNSSWDFEHVLDTMDDYWVGPDENFCPESTPTRWRCYHFSKKWSKSKFDATLSIKKPFVTPKFCGRNFSQMHHFEGMNFLSPIEPLYSSSSL